MINAIIAPWGGFANHLRWILLLDPQFSFQFKDNITHQEIKYSHVKGIDWPEFSSWKTLKKEDLNATILEEISAEFKIDELSLIANEADVFSKPIITLEDKLNFILNRVYPHSRSWQNWLMYEFRYRTQLQNLIFVDHNEQLPTSLKDRAHEYNKIIVCRVDPKLALRTFIKINSHLNHISPGDFIYKIQQENILAQDYLNKHQNVLQLDNTILYNEILDRNFYTKVIEWFGLSDQYEQANIIHERWYRLHVDAEKHMIDDLQQIFKGGEIWN
jgi:hypothetical protein